MRGEGPLVELSDVTRRFDAVTALDHVTLTLHPGQLTALLGPNGAGKTTAVRLMLGLMRPDAGLVRLFGDDPAARRPRTRVGIMLQVARVPETLTAREHIALFRSYYPNPWPVEQVIDTAGLAGIVDRRFGGLSGGQRQRVLFALAICGNPELLFLDEPTVGLDVEARRLFWGAIRTLIEQGRSVLLTTHYLEEADALADRIVVLHQGRLIADGPPAQIKRAVAGRRLRCRTTVGLAEVAHLPGVQSARADGGCLEILTTDAERVARHLLDRDPDLTGLEIAGAKLEEAFMALTASQTRASHEGAVQ